MIKKIKYIKDFGVFKDFIWNANLGEFKNFNLIYAWNYSGKTTLSRVFRSFETRKIHEDFSTAQYELELSDGSIVDSNNIANQSLNIRVFNTDFVSRQLKWETSDSIEPIFILGEENIELQKQLEQLRKESADLNRDYQVNLNQRNEKSEIIDKTIRSRAQAMKKELQLLDYNKTKLENGINSIKDTYMTQILTDANYQNDLQISLDNNKKELIQELLLPDFRIDLLYSNVNEIIRRKVISNVIKKLEENPKLNDWVRVGKELHISEDTCQFCGNKLPADLMDKLEHHFTNDLEKLFRDIESSESTIAQTYRLIDDFSDNLPHPTEFYNDYQLTFVELKNKLDHMLRTIRDQLEALLPSLNNKKINPFQTVNIETDYAAATSTVTPHINDLEGVVQEINGIIKKHNRRTNEFENVKKNAKLRLLNHHIAQFIIDFDYLDKMNEINEINNTLFSLKTKIDKVDNTIKGIEAQLLDAKKGAKKVNEYLNTFFQSNRLLIDVQEDGRFILKRNGKIAKNLSEGEKSAISFIYFITQLENRDTNLKETVVVIDDPISSLDHNHIYSVFAIIKAKLNPKSCKQIIISTHNSEFFNLMKDLSISDIPRFFGKGEKDHEKFVSFYFIERKLSGDEIISTIVPLPQELKNYKSEYVFLFSILKKFVSDPSSEISYRAIIPNVARRFLEAYLNFRNPSSKQGFIQKMSILFPEDTDRFLVYKVTNEYSHNDQVNNRTFYLPEIEECNQVVALIFKCLEEKDKLHFDALLDNIT
jgi:wobble nucleotide-excising tRNase